MTVSYTGSCALYGAGSTYTGSWLYINVLVVLLGLAAVAMIYILSRLFPSRLQGRIAGITRVEFTQLISSIAIIGVLLAFSVSACNLTQSMTSQYLTSAGVSTQLSGMDPFAYSEYYISNLSLNTGIKLLTFLYTESMAYTMDAQVLSKLSADLPRLKGSYPIGSKLLGGSGFSLSLEFATELGIPYSTLSAFYIGIFSSIVGAAIGMLFLQWLALPVIEAVAFTVLLPITLILRSIAYSAERADLRRAANAFLAIAIAAYIIYPLTIALDSYIVHWIYTPCGASATNCNPNFQYLDTAFTIDKISSTAFSSASSAVTDVFNGYIFSAAPSALSLIGSAAPLALRALVPTNVPAQAQYIVNTSAQFLFVSIVLFAFNLAITLVFAQSLTIALDSGIEGESPFWAAL